MYQKISTSEYDASIARLMPIARSVGILNDPSVSVTLATCTNESRGRADAVSSSRAIGLGQIKIGSATETVRVMYHRMTKLQQDIVLSTMGPRLQHTLNQKWMNERRPDNNNTGITVTERDLFNPAFNLVITHYHLMLIGQWIKANDVFDKSAFIAAVYFQGYGFGQRYFKSGLTSDNFKAMPEDVRGYAANIVQLSVKVKQDYSI